VVAKLRVHRREKGHRKEDPLKVGWSFRLFLCPVVITFVRQLFQYIQKFIRVLPVIPKIYNDSTMLGHTMKNTEIASRKNPCIAIIGRLSKVMICLDNDNSLTESAFF